MAKDYPDAPVDNPYSNFGSAVNSARSAIRYQRRQAEYAEEQRQREINESQQEAAKAAAASMAARNKHFKESAKKGGYDKYIYKDVDGNNPVVSAILDVTITGSYTYELSADGGANWETVTNQVSHTFTNVGSDLRVRITESTSGFPTAFGTWGSISSESTDLIKVSYTI